MKRKHTRRKTTELAGLSRTSRRNPTNTLLTTRELLRRARRDHGTIEAYLVLNGGLRATHWLSYCGKGMYVAEGIDGAEYETTARAFAKDYAWAGQSCIWHVDR